MELVLSQLLAYLISVAAGLRTSAIGARRQKKLRKALEEKARELAAINSRKSLREQLGQISARIGQLTSELDVEDEVEQAIWQLLADPIFCDDLVEWLTLWDLPDSEDAKSRLDKRIVNTMESVGADEARVATFHGEFFNMVDNLIFEDSKLARWRHHLGLQALKEDHDEMLRRLREQDGEFSPQRVEEALAKFYANTLKACDIIDLAGLPEDDRHLAMQDFVLRQLYIPLRVKLEGKLEEDDYDIDEEHLQEMEDRRRKQRLDAAGRCPGTENSATDDRIAVAEILRSNTRAVILGDPGGGKTTLMRWFATAFLLRLKDDPNLKELPDAATLPDTAWTPILVRCRDLPHDAHRCDMDEILTQAVRASEVPSQLRGPLIAGLRQQLESGAALLMVDGLDEIQDPMLRARFCRRLEALAVIYDKASMLVTSRIVGYREMRFRMGRSFRITSQ